MNALSNNPVLNLVDEIAAVVREADEAARAGESAKVTGHAKTYQALALALRLHRVAKGDPNASVQLDELYAANRVKKPRKDANPFTRLAKLCFPGRTPVDYSRYASVLLYAERSGMGEEALLDELDECGLTFLAGIAKTVETGESRAEAERRANNDGLDVLEHRPSVATVQLQLPDQVGIAILIKRADAEGTVDVHYLPSPGDAEDAWKRIRKLGRDKAR